MLKVKSTFGRLNYSRQLQKKIKKLIDNEARLLSLTEMGRKKLKVKVRVTDDFTSSLIIRLGLRPNSSGGIREPLRLPVPLPGTIDPLRLVIGEMSFETSIFGASAGALISGNFGCVKSQKKFFFSNNVALTIFQKKKKKKKITSKCCKKGEES